MQEDTINALGMILMIIFTGAMVVIFRAKPMKGIEWKRKIPLAFCGFAFFFVFYILAAPIKQCGNIPECGYQLIIAPSCLFFIILLINKRLVLLARRLSDLHMRL
jgi:hypothetical protein